MGLERGGRGGVEKAATKDSESMGECDVTEGRLIIQEGEQ
jgi:hypothetical protein